MAENSAFRRFLSDGLEALKLVARLSWQRNVTAWLYVPVGILIMLLACFGVNALIGLSSVSFPASVALLVVLFFGLMICDWILGDRKTRALVNVIDVPAGWALRWISIFFTPSFVLLPLSPPISGIEVGKIIAVFLIGFFVMVAVTAWLVRALQLIMGSSKRAVIERAEEMGNESDAIPLANIGRSRQDSEVNLPSGTSTPGIATGTSAPGLVEDITNELTAPQRAQDPTRIRGTGGPPENDIPSEATRNSPPPQAPLPLTRSQRWAAFINLNLDRITYATIFLFIGLPIYYTTGYAMPAQLTFNVLTYFAALALPPRYRQFLHPVLVSAALTILGVWIMGLIRSSPLFETLHTYKTGTNYLDLWHGIHLPIPGAGDIFSSVLDASIVALALPMFSYRKELRRHFFAIVIPNITISVGSLFGYPALCYAIGISSTRSLAFASRSLTLALATPATKNLGGDVNTNAALAIMSGILGVLVGQRVLEWLKIPEDDYVTRGVTLGGNSSAIATALLLGTDPRAAALSSLSMSLFGIITLALTSVPPIVRAIDALVDLGS
ncbi:Plastidal glycolate/glycerate translocator 1-like protein [Lachnellula cervina]|uniref:Plastidal glycolate/glycerate translocator 1-like protein n=1 Tax=Lachnellula cervina TaxID=1316786 RepID=A0A7D8UWB0_9HELO|nr:Plastidal glycolate/glycerate translocator 1-like protein [Lachnellula cervina]